MNNLTRIGKLPKSETSSSPDTGLKRNYTRYRGWLIGIKVIDGCLWLQWQHPEDNFFRYNYPVNEKGLAETIKYVRFLIDMAIKLEQDAEKQVNKI